MFCCLAVGNVVAGAERLLKETAGDCGKSLLICPELATNGALVIAILVSTTSADSAGDRTLPNLGSVTHEMYYFCNTAFPQVEIPA